MISPLTTTSHSLGEAMERLEHRWGWMFALGALFVVLGLLALGLVVTATIASVVMIGVFMAIAGGMEIVVAFDSRSWGRFFLWIVAGLLYLAAGAIAIARPLEAAIFFTLMLGSFLVGAGVVRLWVAAHQPPGRKALPVASSLITILLGALIIGGWPANSFVILGLLLGIDLIFYGANWIAFSLAIRRLGHRHGV